MLDKVPEGITVGPDGNIWFAEEGNRAIGRISMDGTIHEFPLPPEAYRTRDVAAGPDGNVWFTTMDGVGRITPAGVVTLFPMQKGQFSYAITAGADGAMWFTEPGIDHLGRISLDGQIQEYPLPKEFDPCLIAIGRLGSIWLTGCIPRTVVLITPDGGVHEFEPRLPEGLWTIACGPDDSLWLALKTGIARLTADGTFTYFRLAPDEGEPRSITAGLDGAMWFPVTGHRLRTPPVPWIGRITMQGAITEYNLKGGATQGVMTGIAMSPDRSLWVTMFGGGIGKMSPSGHFTVFALPHNRTPMTITAAADGDIWFGDLNLDLIGRVTPTGEITEYPL